MNVGRAIDAGSSENVGELKMHGRRGLDTGVEIRAGGPSRLRRDGLHMSDRDRDSFVRARDTDRYRNAVIRAAAAEGRPTP